MDVKRQMNTCGVEMKCADVDRVIEAEALLTELWAQIFLQHES